MDFYLAPMEGITGYLYRNTYHQHYQPMKRYFSPFLVPNQNKTLSSRELNDILPEHNQGLNLVPQVLTNHAEGLIWTADKIRQLGYPELNINLGCPSKTVVTKGKGSGFLAKPEELDRFFDLVFAKVKIEISVKTRIGKESPEEFSGLLKIYNQYPIKELIIHPRIQTDYYKNKPNLEVFEVAQKESENPVCYNGDIFSPEDYEAFITRFPNVKAIMLGRGVIGNPALPGILSGQTEFDWPRLREFHDRICSGYQEVLSGDRNVLFKMKELWFYMSHCFTDSQKYWKKIKKAQKLPDYQAAVAELFREQAAKGANPGFFSSGKL